MPTRWHMMSEKQLSILIQGRNYARGNRQIIRIPRAFACISAGAPWLWRSVMQIDKVSQEPARLRMLTAPFHGTFFYASAFRRRRHYVFGLSVRPSGCPSVRSLKYPLLTCTWVRWFTRSTVTVLRHVRPSVRPSGEVSGHMPENAWRQWPEILHADVSWPSSELVSLWPWSVDFSNFGTILT